MNNTTKYGYIVIGLLLILAVFVGIDASIQTVDTTQYTGAVQTLLVGLQYFFTLQPVILTAAIARNAYGYIYRVTKADEEYKFKYRLLLSTLVKYQQGITALVLIVDLIAPTLPEAKWIVAGIVWVVDIIYSVLSAKPTELPT